MYLSLAKLSDLSFFQIIHLMRNSFKSHTEEQQDILTYDGAVQFCLKALTIQFQF